jgi:transcription elongation factor GreA
MAKDVILTPEGLEKLKTELEELTTTKRRAVGSQVKVKDGESGKSVTYTIVGSAEANPAEKKLSNESPVARALLGKKAKDKVTVPLPNGKARELTIQKIEVAG